MSKPLSVTYVMASASESELLCIALVKYGSVDALR
jgi:hypothetical protein